MDNSKDDAWTAKNNMHFKKKKKKKKVGRVERESVRGQSLMRIKVVYKRLPFITTKKSSAAIPRTSYQVHLQKEHGINKP